MIGQTVSGVMDQTASRVLLARSGLVPHEAERLLGSVTGANRTAVIGGLEVDANQAVRFAKLVERRKAGEPLQYLEGSVQFGPVELQVDRRVLIPRPETEQLWERVMGLLPEHPCTVVDMGTGSGCLALAIKHERPDTNVVATDISPAALEVARKNSIRLGLEVDFREGDRLAALDKSIRGGVAMLVTNPPYVPERDWPGLPREVREYEPKIALAIGDGLDMYRYIAAEASAWLRPGGAVMAEIGECQGKEVARIFRGNGWEATIGRDWTGRDRFLAARPRR